MTHPREPRAWLEATDDPASSRFESGMVAYGQVGPTAAQCERIWQGLSVAIDAPGTASPAPTEMAGMALAKKLGLLAALAAAVIGAVLGLRPSASDAPERPAGQPTSRAGDSDQRAAPAQAQPQDPPPAPETRGVEAAPPARPPAARARPVRAAPTASDPTAELELLTRARRVLQSTPRRALELAEQHARAYPRGVFAEEREVIAIEALMRAGRSSEAAARGREFLRRHPHSAHAGRVGALLGAR